jgi:hypothetical protein
MKAFDKDLYDSYDAMAKACVVQFTQSIYPGSTVVDTEEHYSSYDVEMVVNNRHVFWEVSILDRDILYTNQLIFRRKLPIGLGGRSECSHYCFFNKNLDTASVIIAKDLTWMTENHLAYWDLCHNKFGNEMGLFVKYGGQTRYAKCGGLWVKMHSRGYDTSTVS